MPPAITGWAQANSGIAQNVRWYEDDAAFGVQTLKINNRLTSQLMHRQLYQSRHNKPFHLGLIEGPGVTLVYGDYLHIRIYEIAGPQ